MRTFDEIFAIVAKFKGGTEALEAYLSKLSQPLNRKDLRMLPEDRWLSSMTKCVFNSGFKWKVVNAMWAGFEETFNGFDVDINANMTDGTLAELLKNRAIIRNSPKIASIRGNAKFLLELRKEGGVGNVLGEWPSTDFASLLQLLKNQGSRLGGRTGQYAMLFVGRDGFLLSHDATRRLMEECIIESAPKSDGEMQKIQDAFNVWTVQSNRNLIEISRVLAMSM